MKRYQKLFEYDPVMMRALAGNPQRPISKSSSGKKLPDWVIKDNQLGGDSSIEALSTVVRPNINHVYTTSQNRIVCYNGNTYSITNKDPGIHMNLLCWLIMNKGLDIPEDELFGWNRVFATSVPFICLATDLNSVYFSESYNYSLEKKLVQYRDKKFKKEINRLIEMGFTIEDQIIR